MQRIALQPAPQPRVVIKALAIVRPGLQHYAPYILPTRAAISAERMRRQFSLFVKEAWKIIEPATPLVWNWHLDAICDHVQALVTNTLGKQNLVINVPPGSMKSTIVSICVVPWLWTRRPAYRGAFASGVPGIESRDSGKCRMIIESAWYRDTFAIPWTLSKDQNEKLYYRNTATGERLATTTGAGVTGHRFNGLFVDDALDARKAFQQPEVDKVNLWWDQAFWNRIADEHTSTRCITGQRLREDDLPGHILDREAEAIRLDAENNIGDVEVLIIPQEWEEKQRRVTTLGWTDPRTAEGELMFEARFPKKAINAAKLVLGRSGYEGQHQQRPSLLKGEIFEVGHANLMQRAMIPAAKIIQVVMSLDSAIKEKEENDYSVCLVGIEFDLGVFIAECWRDKVKYTGLKEIVKTMGDRVKPHALLVEDKASGQQLIQEFEQSTNFALLPITPNVDKVARARPLTPYWEANRVWFPCDDKGVAEPWVEVFTKELYSFPKAAHDDQVDAFTQLLQFLFLAPGARGLLDYYKQGAAADKLAGAAERATEAAHHPVDYVQLNGAQRQ